MPEEKLTCDYEGVETMNGLIRTLCHAVEHRTNSPQSKALDIYQTLVNHNIKIIETHDSDDEKVVSAYEQMEKYTDEIHDICHEKQMSKTVLSALTIICVSGLIFYGITVMSK